MSVSRGSRRVSGVLLEPIPLPKEAPETPTFGSIGSLSQIGLSQMALTSVVTPISPVTIQDKTSELADGLKKIEVSETSRRDITILGAGLILGSIIDFKLLLCIIVVIALVVDPVIPKIGSLRGWLQSCVNAMIVRIASLSARRHIEEVE